MAPNPFAVLAEKDEKGAEGILTSGTGGAASGIGGTVSGNAALGTSGVTNLRMGLLEGLDRPVLKVTAADADVKNGVY